MHANLKGKTVLISGASSGIGLACAHEFAAAGSRLILFDINAPDLKHAVREIKTNHADVEVHSFKLDVSKKSAVQKKIQALPKEWTHIDILINNAGCASGYNKIQDGDIDDWEKMINVNVKGLLYVTRAVLPSMVKQNTGTIINVSSISSRIAYPYGNIYCATKAAVRMISDALRVDLVDTNIRTVDIQPGKVRTAFNKQKFKTEDKKIIEQSYNGYCPLEPKDIAEVIAFAASRPAHVQIHEILLTCTDQANAYVFNKKMS